MAFNDPLRNREPEAGAPLFSGEERLEEIRACLRADPFTFVNNSGQQAAATLTETHNEFSSVRHGLEGVEQEIQKYLFDLLY